MARTAFVAVALGMIGATNALTVTTPSDGTTVVADRCVHRIYSTGYLLGREQEPEYTDRGRVLLLEASRSFGWSPTARLREIDAVEVDRQ